MQFPAQLLFHLMRIFLDGASVVTILLRSKSFPSHLLSPFQFNTRISSGSEKAGHVGVVF